MKKRLTTISMAIFGYLLISIILSLFISLLSYKGIISPFISDTLTYGLSVILCFITALFYGYKSHKRGLLNGLKIGFFYLLLTLLLRFLCIEKVTLISNIFLIIKLTSLLVGSILGVNIYLKKHNP